QQTPPPTAPPAAPPVAAAPPAEPPKPATEPPRAPETPAPPSRSPQIEAAVKLARDQLARGDRQQGLSTLTGALKQVPDDADLKGLLNDTLTDARGRLQRAHQAANE